VFTLEEIQERQKPKTLPYCLNV